MRHPRGTLQDFGEYCVMVRESEPAISDAELRARFAALDEDGSGKVDMDEILKGGSESRSPRSSFRGSAGTKSAAGPGGKRKGKGKKKGGNLLIIEMLGETSAVVAKEEGSRKQSSTDVARSLQIALVSQEERTSARLAAIEKGASARAERVDETLARLERSISMLLARFDGGGAAAAQGGVTLPPLSQLPSATPEEDRAQRMAKRQSRQLRRGRSAGAVAEGGEEGREEGAVASSQSAAREYV